MAKASVSNLRNRALSALLSWGVLAAMVCAPLGAHADCGEFVLGSSPISEKIYRDSLTQTALPFVGVLPEEILALFGRGSTEVDLFKLLTADLGVKRVRFGSNFKIKGGRFFGERLLVLKRLDLSQPEGRSDYLAGLAQVMFLEKQRQLKLANPVRYVRELTAFGEKLSKLTGITELPRFNYFTYGLRAIFGLTGSKKLWPPTNARLGLHWTITRAFAALWISTLAMNVVHLPEVVDTVQMLIEMQDIAAATVNEISNMKIDPVGDRLAIISMYEGRIVALEEQILSSEPGDVTTLQQRIETYKILIESLRADLAKLPPV